MTAPVRVAFVSSHAQPGGSERYLELLLAALGPAWVAGVVCLQDGPLVSRLRAAGHPVTVLATSARLGMLPSALRLRRILRRLAPDVVHANGIKAGLVAGLAASGTRLPVVWVKHDFSWDGPVTRVAALLAADTVGVSQAVVRELPGGAVVVPNGLPDHLPADPVRGRAVLGDCPAVVLVGRLNRVKGQLELLDAAPAVLERRPDVRFFLVGAKDANEPEYSVQVHGRIAALGLEDRVRALGHRDDVLDLVAAAAVAAVPSGPNGAGLRGEGFGLAALEAMRLGTPVVGWRAGALPEVVGDAGLLVEPGDVSALAAAILRILDDPAQQARLAAAGRERARCFTLDRMAGAMRARYVAVAGARAVRARRRTPR